jgi:hypothetical protein
MSYPPLTFDLNLLPPGQMEMPRILASAIGGGQTASGIISNADMSGGGLVAVTYSNVQLGNANQGAMRYWNRLASALAGGVRPIIVPMLVDWIQPVARPFGTGLTPFSDGALFSDGSEFYSPPVTGTIMAGATVGAGTISVLVIGGSGILEGGEWLGINHSVKGNRVYNVVDVDGYDVDGDGNRIYTIGIRPTLRQALLGGEPVDWWRPKCVMKLAKPIVTSVEKYWWSTPSIELIEYFGEL